jgi:hypothetical protein
MSNQTASVGISSTLTTLLTQGSASLGGTTCNTVDIWLQSNSGVPVPLNSYFAAHLPTNGVFKLYLQLQRPADIFKLFDSSGNLLTQFTGSTQIVYQLTRDTSISGNVFPINVSFGTLFPANTLALFFRWGMTQILQLPDFVLDSQIDNLLALDVGETFSQTSNGVIIQLNRIFTAGTALPIFRFTAASVSGSYQVTSNNAQIVRSDTSVTLFAAGQNIGDYVSVLQTTTNKTPITLTMVISGVGTETPLDLAGIPL